MNERLMGSIAAQETRRIGRPPKKPSGVQFTIYVPDQHFLDAIKDEAAVRRMSVNAFMRAMIRGYFGAALHCR